MTRDLLFAVRSLRRSPAFAIGTILTLAIGIGAATAIYSVADTILFRPLPFPGGDRLVPLIVAALASYLPVRRATRVDPIAALRFD